jgi:hypothetical protein
VVRSSVAGGFKRLAAQAKGSESGLRHHAGICRRLLNSRAVSLVLAAHRPV